MLRMNKSTGQKGANIFMTNNTLSQIYVVTGILLLTVQAGTEQVIKSHVFIIVVRQLHQWCCLGAVLPPLTSNSVVYYLPLH